MNILIDINHPAHVHLYKNLYRALVGKGHQVTVVVKDIPAAIRLLDLYGIPFRTIGSKNDSLWHKGLDQLLYDWKIWWLASHRNIDIGLGSSINIPHASALCRMKSIICDDDDDAVEPLFAKYAHPFANVILSPQGTVRKAKQTIYIPTYHELAYLHPNTFTPDPTVLQEAGLKEGEPYFILRFNAFKAHHDTGVVGLTIENKRCLIQMLSAKGKVFITTERNIDDEFRPYQLTLSPDKAHSLIYYATMLVGDSQTMTSEAAVLGTPAIRCNTFVGRIHYLEEEEQRYGLTFGFRPEQPEDMFRKIEELLSMPDLKQVWQERRRKMLADKIDYTKFLTWFVENYPNSKDNILQATFGFWDKFK
ncbi:MAG: DUF354 domain-containing protein [Paludibacter sp.]|nr:DUF354 domain-containing protein [Bacteroidales bacterium]MCM1069063.1 DUF354 domain-containing protein [Prevotella sp.]MCM1353502.1 DUF354 domain-containing protein [Bacteroides sp.]MCM1442663.1 DUF354 domain-containing protein [Muribaculum sp.]MCM1481700.1 DUF354 domain-containing protein [Paludibacter sp.]